MEIKANNSVSPVIAEESYYYTMLKESGLSQSDLMASVFVCDESGKEIKKQVCTFTPGTVNQFGDIVDGNDVIIHYYDLSGHQITYEITERQKDGKKQLRLSKNYFRVRWSNPDDHLNKDRKPYKYHSPAGSGTPLYIPQYIRTAYESRQVIKRLYIQEGEKKAEKACKHGIPSVGISGIMNLGYNGTLPLDLIYIIKECRVEEVILMFDGDWQNLSRELNISEDISKRPRCFYYAAKNYKDYMRSLSSQNLYVDIYIGHVISQNDDKGIDDLLNGTLRGREEEMLKDLNDAICMPKEKHGRYCEMFKITDWSDMKIKALWGLDSVKSFAALHIDQLKTLPEFVFSSNKWKITPEGEVVSTTILDPCEKFWTEREIPGKDGSRMEYKFDHANSLNFLERRGYGRYRLRNDEFDLIRVDGPFVRTVKPFDARDHVLNFAKVNCNHGVYDMLLKGITQYLGPDKMSLLEFVEPRFLQPETTCQYMYFADNCWKITPEAVEEKPYSQISHHIWANQRHADHRVTYIGKLIEFSQNPDGTYHYSMTEQGRRCHFLRFLENCSNFTDSMNPESITAEDIMEDSQHLLSKLCAIGYLAMDVKDPSNARAVIAMDGVESEVGTSNGRTGKSLIGELLKHITPTVYINGKKPNLLEDSFVWHEVNERTRIVFIDDVRQNFNLELLFPCITGDWQVNYKHGSRLTLPYSSSPKLYIPTNHAIKGDGSSFRERQWLLAFSDYYNDNHKPQDDFHELFFSGWDEEQWNLTWNLISNCIQLYMNWGVIQAPGERLEERKLRQEMSEEFINWADEYYSVESRLNTPIPKDELEDSFFNKYPKLRVFVSTTGFKTKIKKYCKYKGYVYNPQMLSPDGRPVKFDRHGKPVMDDKRNGREYITVALVDNVVKSEPDKPF